MLKFFATGIKHPYSNWEDLIIKIATELEKILLPVNEFEEILNYLIKVESSPIKGINFSVNCERTHKDFEIGRKLDEEPSASSQLTIGSPAYRIKLAYWIGINLKNITGSKISELLETLFISFWKPDFRDEKSRIISTLHPTLVSKIDNTIDLYKSESINIYFYYCDLDKFKEINTKYDHSVGDEAILDFSYYLDEYSRGDAIPIHRSGDEFIILYPSNNYISPILLANKIQNNLKKTALTSKKIVLSNTCGISSFFNSTPDIVDYKEFEKLAENASEPKPNNKLRGETSFFLTDTKCKSSFEFSQDNLLRAKCLIKNNLQEEIIFSNQWLNSISYVTSKVLISGDLFSKSSIKKIQEYIDWVKPRDGMNLLSSCSKEDDYNVSKELSNIDLLLSICHGIFRFFYTNNLDDIINLKILYDSTNINNCGLILNEKTTIYSFGEMHNPIELELGENFKAKDSTSSSNRFILIKIGNYEMNIPKCLFADIIVVDDRPTIGGGLPDFWEATFARLFNTMNKNKNIDEIYILGNIKNGEKTIAKLKSVHKWEGDIDTLASRIGVKPNNIRNRIDIIKNNVHYVDSSAELLEKMSLGVNNSIEFQKSTEEENHFHNIGFLKRQIDLTPFLLGKQDGIKVKTIAEAFPLILDIAREESQKNKIKDQAGEMLGELIDFKVQLTDPTNNTIPNFYLHEKDNFDQYFNTQFLTSEGLFGKYFELGQKKAVINHIIKSINNPKSAFATRRAILIIPHEINNEDDVSPLGLISVRIIPRFTEYNRVILSYSFTWRTVEALVGFPYSIYGSVKFAEHLTQEINNSIDIGNLGNIKIGEVFYVAHSLHIFTDDYGQAIAKKIIDEASI